MHVHDSTIYGLGEAQKKLAKSGNHQNTPHLYCIDDSYHKNDLHIIQFLVYGIFGPEQLLPSPKEAIAGPIKI